MLQNAYFLAKIGADTAENEQHFAEILPKTANYPQKDLPGVVRVDRQRQHARTSLRTSQRGGRRRLR